MNIISRQQEVLRYRLNEQLKDMQFTVNTVFEMFLSEGVAATYENLRTQKASKYKYQIMNQGVDRKK